MAVNKLLIRFLFTFFCCCLATGLYSQALHGKVVDAETGLGLAGASIFINNTSLGATSDSSGAFQIKNPIDGDLIVSFVGYEKLATPVNIKNMSGKRLLLKIDKKQESLEEVLIINDATRAKYLEQFKRNFLGITEAAWSSKIENLKDIYFIRPEDGSTDGISARSEKPLTIINKKLGYKITFDIVDFYYNNNTGLSFYYGYTLFEELGDKKRYDKQRRQSYFGSSLHFFRSLLTDSVEENGFEVRNNITDSSMKLNGQYVRKSYKFDRKNALAKDSASDFVSLAWKDELMIRYGRGAYVQPSTKNGGGIISSRNPTSGLTKISDVIWIDKYGIVVNPMHLYTSGYWSNYKVANMLPYNYQP